jgi:hypothetical protein
MAVALRIEEPSGWLHPGVDGVADVEVRRIGHQDEGRLSHGDLRWNQNMHNIASGDAN